MRDAVSVGPPLGSRWKYPDRIRVGSAVCVNMISEVVTLKCLRKLKRCNRCCLVSRDNNNGDADTLKMTGAAVILA